MFLNGFKFPGKLSGKYREFPNTLSPNFPNYYSAQFSSVAQSCPTRDPMNRSTPGLRLTSIESVMPSSHLILCCPLLLLPPTPPSIRVFSNESTLCMRWPKYWSGLQFPSPRDLPDQGIEPGSPAFQADALTSEPPGKPMKNLVQFSSASLCNPMDCSLPGSSLHGILQARVLEWVAISFSRGSSQPRD